MFWQGNFEQIKDGVDKRSAFYRQFLFFTNQTMQEFEMFYGE